MLSDSPVDKRPGGRTIYQLTWTKDSDKHYSLKRGRWTYGTVSLEAHLPDNWCDGTPKPTGFFWTTTLHSTAPMGFAPSMHDAVMEVYKALASDRARTYFITNREEFAISCPLIWSNQQAAA